MGDTGLWIDSSLSRQRFMNPAQNIRNAVSRVSALRQASQADPALHGAITSVKRFQARRFAHTYADLLSSGPYQDAARFFLDELYSDKDYSQRDAQFSRIAGALQTFFPMQVVAIAVSLAGLHALTEDLDHKMGIEWLLAAGLANANEAQRYGHAWRAVGRRQDRDTQLNDVLAVGDELDKLTRASGLRMMLKMMRRPASAAGLSSLQSFLESGFDTFAELNGRGKGAQEFLRIVRERESLLIEELFARTDEDSASARPTGATTPAP